MTFKELLENSPLGSFEDLRDKVREAIKEMQNKAPFEVEFQHGEPIQTLPWIIYMFPSKVVVEWMNDFFEMTYKIGKKGNVTLGTPKKVEMVFENMVKEKDEPYEGLKGLKTELKEAGITMLKEKAKEDLDLDITGFISLKEAKFDIETGELKDVVLIEQGTNSGKRRHYPVSTIKEAAPHFSGLKMYIDHPTAAQDKAMPERSIKDWASTIVESHYEEGCALANIVVHDPWLRERLADPVFRENIGLSINAGGQISYGKIDGQEVQIIEKIVMHRRNGPASVDWVTEAGARGRVSRLLKESKTGGKSMDLGEATLDDIQKENPKLLESITAHVKTNIKESGSAEKDAKELKDLREGKEASDLKDKYSTQTALVESILGEIKELKEAVKKRVTEQMTVKLYESEAELKEAVAGCIKKELEYVNQFSTKGKVKTSDGQESSEDESGLLESLGKDLDERAHVSEALHDPVADAKKKKEEDKEKLLKSVK